MAIDPVTTGIATIGSIATVVGIWLHIYRDPEVVRQTKLRKLNDKADKLKKQIEELQGK